LLGRPPPVAFPRSLLKTLAQVAAEIGTVQEGHVPTVAPLYRNGNRRVTTGVTDMKNMIRFAERIDDLAELEDMINDCPFSAIGMDTPRMRFERHCLQKPT
jgi:hypothetical protein